MRTRRQVRNFGQDITNREVQLPPHPRKRGKIESKLQVQPLQHPMEPEVGKSKPGDQIGIGDHFQDIMDFAHSYFADILGQQAYIPRIGSFCQNAPEVSSKRNGPLFAMSPELTGNMRDILMGWLMEVNYKMSFGIDTLYLTIFLVDKFCTLSEVTKMKYQLVGTACLFMAGKYEEVATPKLKKIMDLISNLYSAKQILTMQSEILVQLEFQISQPSVHWYLLAHLTMLQSNSPTLPHESEYLCQLCLLHPQILQRYPPQVISAAILQFLVGDQGSSKMRILLKLGEVQGNLVGNCLGELREVYAGRMMRKYQFVNYQYRHRQNDENTHI